MVRAVPASNFQKTPFAVVESFDTNGDWTVSGGTIASDVANVRHGAQSLQLNVTAAGGNCFVTKTISRVYKPSVIRLWVYVPDATSIKNVDLFISSSSTFTSFFKATNSTGFDKGWNCLVYHADNFSNTGGESWANTMVRLRVRIDANTGVTTNVSVDALEVEGFNRAKILITADDGWLSQYSEMFGYMNPRGLKGTIYTIRDTVDTAGYFSTAQANEIYNAGWDLGNHSIDATNLATLPTATAKQNVSDNRDWLITKGWPRGGSHLAFPNGGYNDALLTALGELGMLTARTINEQTNRVNAHEYPNYYTLKCGLVLNTTTPATILGWVDNAIKTGGALILVYHKIIASPTVSTEHAITDFQTEMDGIVARKKLGLIDDTPVSQWYNGLFGARAA